MMEQNNRPTYYMKKDTRTKQKCLNRGPIDVNNYVALLLTFEVFCLFRLTSRQLLQVLP